MTKGIKDNDFFFFSVFVFVVSGCGLPRLLRSLAMTKGARGGIHKLVIARVAYNKWQSQYDVL